MKLKRCEFTSKEGSTSTFSTKTDQRLYFLQRRIQIFIFYKKGSTTSTNHLNGSFRDVLPVHRHFLTEKIVKFSTNEEHRYFQQRWGSQNYLCPMCTKVYWPKPEATLFFFTKSWLGRCIFYKEVSMSTFSQKIPLSMWLIYPEI